jgi:molybdopterin molybdotransferase
MINSNFLESYISFPDALKSIRSKIIPLGTEQLSIELCTERISAENLFAQVDSPSSDISLMDGFAIKSNDIVHSSLDSPVLLTIVGSAFAGTLFDGSVKVGTAVKIFSGALIPEGSDAVIPNEYCEEISSTVSVKTKVKQGAYIVRRGEEIKSGSLILKENSLLSPRYMGLVSAAGIFNIKVYKKPLVSIISIGDELVAPGNPLKKGHTYANNQMNIYAWLTSYGINCSTTIVADNRDSVKSELLNCLSRSDAIITSGGAWKSERDLTLRILDELGWNKIFSHVRMRPGKGTSFGFLQDKPVFCLPGGPAGNQKAFLQLALPGITRLGGRTNEPLQTLFAKLKVPVKSIYQSWTEFKDAELFCDPIGNYSVAPCQTRSSAMAMASANCIICIPENRESLVAGELIPIQLQTPLVENLLLRDNAS